jgi:cell division protein ZapA (FtsZ GTPase activity inhibitor)
LNSVIEIKLLGQVYGLKTDLNISQAKAVAKCVEEKVEEADRDSEGHSRLDTAVLVALDIAGDFLELQEKHANLIDGIVTRSEFLLRRIETKRLESLAKRSAPKQRMILSASPGRLLPHPRTSCLPQAPHL